LFGKSESDYKDSPHLDDSSGYWLSVAFSILRRSESAIEKLSNFNELDTAVDNILNVFYDMRNTSLIQFINVIATVGDISLQKSGGNSSLTGMINTKSPHDVDFLPDSEGSRVHKGRRSDGVSSLERSISARSIPSAYLLPGNVIKAAVDMGNIFTGQNPAKGMLGSGLIEKTYLDMNLDGSYNKIPDRVVKELEDRLEAEYVPFYIQDLRTNEIIAFHAFLDKLTDTIGTTYGSNTGYGRLDPVRNYETTTRSVSVGFTLIATSKEDFDEMWFKINKFTTLLYPQWTQGMKIQSGKNSFIQPFSQVLGATPVVRLRVGDVIKSNYSRFNLARIFGIGDKDTDIQTLTSRDDTGGLVNSLVSAADPTSGYNKFVTKAFYTLFGSPLQFEEAAKDLLGGGAIAANALNAVADIGQNFLVNGFANPLSVALIMNQLRDPDIDNSITIPTPTTGIGRFVNAVGTDRSSIDTDAIGLNGYTRMAFVKLKPTRGKPYFCIDNNREYILDRSIDVMVAKKETSNQRAKVSLKNNRGINSGNRTRFGSTRTVYKVIVVDPSEQNLFGKTFTVYHTDLEPDYADTFNKSAGLVLSLQNPLAALGSGIKAVALKAGAATGMLSDQTIDQMLTDLNLTSEEARFMSPEYRGKVNNPITKAFETSMGRGLAGVLDGVTFDWLDGDFGWETDWNSRAPTGVKISFKLDVIHDLPPGLDHSGFNRAPLYNVGGVMDHVAGDSNGRNESRKFNFKSRMKRNMRTSKGIDDVD